MLVNNDGSTQHVTFVAYSGRYPNLCSGILVLRIDGVEYKFHPYIMKPSAEYHPSFWSSGGGHDADWCPYQAPWCIDVKMLPEEIRQYAEEIDQLFNYHVPHGCCGGCA